jgi:hypothetical protein
MTLALEYIAPLSGDKPSTGNGDGESCLGVMCGLRSEMLEV